MDFKFYAPYKGGAMIRIAIVEDEDSYIQILSGYLEQYGEEHSISFHTSTFHDGLDIVTDYKADYDIILMDIQMKHLDGMKTAEKIRKLDEDVSFIFITSTVSFAVQGYLVDALGYVVKPVSYLAFSQILRKAIKKVAQKQEKTYLTFEVEGGQMRLDISQIYYIESQRHHILIHTEKGDFLTAGPLKKIEVLLNEKGFSKCHNAYLVHLMHVTGIVQNNVILSDSTPLPVSRAKKKVFLEALTDYMGGVTR